MNDPRPQRGHPNFPPSPERASTVCIYTPCLAHPILMRYSGRGWFPIRHRSRSGRFPDNFNWQSTITWWKSARVRKDLNNLSVYRHSPLIHATGCRAKSGTRMGAHLWPSTSSLCSHSVRAGKGSQTPLVASVLWEDLRTEGWGIMSSIKKVCGFE